MKSFYEWWDAHYANKFESMPGALSGAWKEIAYSGYKAGLERAVEIAAGRLKDLENERYAIDSATEKMQEVASLLDDLEYELNQDKELVI
jgi:hypothetical protein